MIFSVVIILLVGVIAYFHYVQGFLTSLLTAVSAVFAAVIAISYHENLADFAFKNRLTDEGTAFSLVLLFAVTFVSLRLISDALIPGNIRLPVLMDKIGSGVFGLVAGIFATGVFAVAAQTLPFGPSIMGQSRFKTQPPRSVTVPNAGRQSADSYIYDELVSEKLNPDDRQSLFLPVDEWVLEFVSMLSDGGSLEGDRTLASVHPNYLDEAFGERLGIQPGAEHMAVNSPAHNQVTVPLAYTPGELAEADAEIPQLRNGTLQLIKPTLKADGSNVILVVRVLFDINASDTDKSVRFSTGAIRLVASGTDYYPLGTIDEAGVLRMNKPDDPLLVGVSDGPHAADVVFYVPKTDVLQGGVITKKSDGTPVSETFGSFAQGVFLDVKRLARVDLSSVKIVPPQASDKTLNVLRKKGIPAPSATVAAPAELGVDSPVEFDHVDATGKIFTPIAVGLYDGDNTSVTFGSSTALIRGKRFAKLSLAATKLTDLPVGDNGFDELFVPPGMKAVQVVGTLPPKANDPWAWAEHLGDFSITDSTEKAYKPSGALAKVMKSIMPMAVGAYDADAGVTSIPTTVEVRPTDVTLIFLVPDGVTLKELDYQGKRLAPLNQSVAPAP